MRMKDWADQIHDAVKLRHKNPSLAVRRLKALVKRVRKEQIQIYDESREAEALSLIAMIHDGTGHPESAAKYYLQA